VRSNLAGWALIGAGVFYAFFQGGAVTDLGPGDGVWFLGLAMHGVLIVLTLVGLIGLGRSWQLEGWTGTVWWASTGLAALGLTVGHVFWSLALFGLAAVVYSKGSARWVAALLAAGAGLWLYLFLVGLRVGDENGRHATSFEEGTAIVAILMMSFGLIALGWTAQSGRRSKAMSADSAQPIDGA
jgi:hypothetical protein